MSTLPLFYIDKIGFILLIAVGLSQHFVRGQYSSATP